MREIDLQKHVEPYKRYGSTVWPSDVRRTVWPSGCKAGRWSCQMYGKLEEAALVVVRQLEEQNGEVARCLRDDEVAR